MDSEQMLEWVSPELPKNWERGMAIRKGRFGTVFLVVDKDNPKDEKFVVKEVYLSFRRHGQTYNTREIDTLKLLNHKRIVPFYGYKKSKDIFCTFFGYMKKGSLKDYVFKKDGLSEEKTSLFTGQILEGVNYLHAHTPSIIHGDITGSNVLLEDENNIRLSGFCESKILHNFTKEDSHVGKVKWMAPEMVKADRYNGYDVKVDIWSIACTVVQMITKYPPFSKLDNTQVSRNLLKEVPPQYNLPENSSEALRNFLNRTFKHNPVERPTSEELLRDAFITGIVDFPKKWTKGRLVSTGSHGNVYIVQDEANPEDELFVVKEMITTITSRDLILKQFRNEIDVLTKVKHEKIVTLYGFCESENKLSIFMKYMNMGSLDNYIKTNGPLNEKQAQQFTKDILEGVQFLHENRFIHGHISGKHIFLESERKVKLGGFSVTKMFCNYRNVKRLQKKSELITHGSINWMAPEMVAAIMDDHGNTYDEKVDIWSVGCTVVQMVTGNPPFTDLEQQQITFQLASGNPPIYNLPEQSSPAIRNFLYQAFHFQASLRPSATDLITKHAFIREVTDSSTDLSIPCTPDQFSDEVVSLNVKTEELPQMSNKSLPKEYLFFSISKRYWSTLVQITGQPLLLEYYHKSSHNISPWFERVKKSSVTKNLELLMKEKSDVDLGIFKDFSINTMTDALIFTSLILSYNNRLLDTLKKSRLLQEKQVSTEAKDLIDVVDAVSSALTRCQALLPWSVSAWLKEVDGHLWKLQSKVDHMSCIDFNKQQLDEFNFSQNLVVYDVDILCSVLGLDPEFSKCSKQIDVDMWLHDLEASRVLTWVTQNNENIQQDEPANEFMHQVNVVKQKLILLGFTECKSASIADDITEDWINHQSALDLASDHILDMFQCHPVLTETSGFPYNNTVTGVLFEQTVKFDDGETASDRGINMINVSDFNKDEARTIFQRYIKVRKTEAGDEFLTLYHGTSHAYIKSILTEGIKLKVGKPRQDFSDSDGFYLSYVFNFAKERACRSKRPAVIVYMIAKSTLQQFTELCLDENNVEWSNVIKYCRKGYKKPKAGIFSKCHYIVGPMCKNPESVAFGTEEPMTHTPVKRQMCIRSDELADIFNRPDNITCVVFYDETFSGVRKEEAGGAVAHLRQF